MESYTLFFKPCVYRVGSSTCKIRYHETSPRYTIHEATRLVKALISEYPQYITRLIPGNKYTYESYETELTVFIMYTRTYSEDTIDK